MSEIQTYTPSNGAMLVCSSGGDYIKTKDHLATIARLEAEIADLRAEVEQLKKELRILYSSNADMFARAEQAEKELAAERGKVEKQYELIDFYDAKVAAVMKWRESAYIPDDSDENELKRILLGE